MAERQVWGIGCWRNEADIAAVNVFHHLSQGLDHLLILDNGSTDGTYEILTRLGRRHPILVRQSADVFDQAAILTELAREAGQRGADWVIPIDADEFWHAPGTTLKTIVQGARADALAIQVTNFVQRRDRTRDASNILLTMTQSVRPRASVLHAEELVTAGHLPFVAYAYPAKVICRAHPDLVLGWGSHSANRSIENCPDVSCLHAPLRSLEALERKAVLDKSDEDLQDYLRAAWHVRRWRELAAHGRLHDEWVRNSWDSGGGSEALLVEDMRLSELVRPWITSAPPSVRTPAFVLNPLPVRVWGVSVVRNEADIIAANVQHHLSLGLERMLVIDNGSGDGTTAVLDQLQREDPRLEWRSIPGVFRQDEYVTGLAREAFERGATWILPIDADEFWWLEPGTSLESLLATAHTALRCQVVNFVQDRNVKTNDGLNSITYRPVDPVGPADLIRESVEDGEIPYIVAEYPDKWISKASPFLTIARGNHSTEGLLGSVAHTQKLVCLHAPLRSRAQLIAKREHGRRLDEQDLPDQVGWHVRRWARMTDEGLGNEWALNSYDNRSAGQLHGWKLVADDRLAKIAERRTSGPVAKLTETQSLTWAEDASEEIVTAIRGIEGWLTDREGIELGRLAVSAASDCGPTDRAVIVEVGSYCGKSTVAMAHALRTASAIAVVVAIDPHTGLTGAADGAVGLARGCSTWQTFLSNLNRAGVRPWVVPIERRSYEVPWDRAISMLFIDGLHDRASVESDINQFEPWLMAGGLLVAHDYVGPFPAVRMVIDERVANGRLELLRIVDSMVVLRKSGGRR